MSDNRDPDAYMKKARESLAGAQSEFDQERFNNSTNRAYYAAFQAAISALLRDGIRRQDDKWPHTFVQSEFAVRLINRRRRYPARFRASLAELQRLRHRADYRGATITRPDARNALRLSGEFDDAVRDGGGSQ
jgi:uncharacterized protein (UPF0332 family)